MDIAFKSVGEASALSGQPFQPDDAVWSCLVRGPDGVLDRVDVLQSERESLQLEGSVICQWGHRIRRRDQSEAEEKRAALQSAEEIFLSLFDGDSGEGQSGQGIIEETRERLQFFLALQLERKRVLRAVGRRRYRHVPSGREFEVPDMEITPEMLTRFNTEIAMMGGTAQ